MPNETVNCAAYKIGKRKVMVFSDKGVLEKGPLIRSFFPIVWS